MFQGISSFFFIVFFLADIIERNKQANKGTIIQNMSRIVFDTGVLAVSGAELHFNLSKLRVIFQLATHFSGIKLI